MTTTIAPIEVAHRNEVILRGRVSGFAGERTLPSGDTLCSFRLVVRRANATSGAVVDALDCAVWTDSVRRTTQDWTDGDIVEIHGALRRRFWRNNRGPASRYEIEVTSAHRLARADPHAVRRRRQRDEDDAEKPPTTSPPAD